MGLDSKALPANFLRRMTAKERRAIGPAATTPEEAQEKCDSQLEKVLQNQIANLLRQRDIWFDRSRMDKKTTRRKGIADFIIVLHGGKALMVEVKIKGRPFTSEQKQDFEDYYRQTGDLKHAVYSLDQFRALLDSYSGNGTPPQKNQ